LDLDTNTFSQKLSNLELWSLLTTYRKLYRAFQRTRRSAILDVDAKTRFSGKLCNLVSCNWDFQRTDYWIPKIQDGWDLLSWKSTWCLFFLPRVVRFG